MNNKSMMVVSRGSWRGVPIYETGKIFKSFLVCLGGATYGFITLGEATAFIDAYYALRAN